MQKVDILRHNMGNNYSSPWTDIYHKFIGSRDFKYMARSVELYWSDVSFTGVPAPNGKIKIYYSNSRRSYKLAQEIDINTINNFNDAVLFELNPTYTSFRIEYLKNGIDGGTLTISINYR